MNCEECDNRPRSVCEACGRRSSIMSGMQMLRIEADMDLTMPSDQGFFLYGFSVHHAKGAEGAYLVLLVMERAKLYWPIQDAVARSRAALAAPAQGGPADLLLSRCGVQLVPMLNVPPRQTLRLRVCSGLREDGNKMLGGNIGKRVLDTGFEIMALCEWSKDIA